MKVQEIQVGRVYHDGKLGLREVVALEGSPICVRYRILSAKIEREHDRHGNEVVLVGAEREVTLQAFAAWAKASYDAQAGAQILLGLKASKIKLSPGEVAYLASVRAETLGAPINAGTLVTYDHTEGRAVAGLQKKGMVRRVGVGEIEVLELGAARINGGAGSERNDEVCKAFG